MVDESKDAANYLVKHLEPKTASPRVESINPTISKLLNPLGVVNYEYGVDGEASLAKEGYQLSFSYEALSPEKISPEVHHLVELSTGGLGTSYILKDFKLTNTVKGTHLSLGDIVPEGTTVIFDPFVDSRYSSMHVRGKTMILYGNIASFGTILVLLHEAGHLTTRTAHTEMNKEEESRRAFEGETTLTQEHIARVLRSERDAWAFALKKIRSLFGEKSSLFTRENFFVWMNGALQTYSEEMRGRLATEIEATSNL